jgi:hypothetical protein
MLDYGNYYFWYDDHYDEDYGYDDSYKWSTDYIDVDDDDDDNIILIGETLLMWSALSALLAQ